MLPQVNRCTDVLKEYEAAAARAVPSTPAAGDYPTAAHIATVICSFCKEKGHYSRILAGVPTNKLSYRYQ